LRFFALREAGGRACLIVAIAAVGLKTSLLDMKQVGHALSRSAWKRRSAPPSFSPRRRSTALL
jgi:hypothetical protein